jgi:hypothetical protein
MSRRDALTAKVLARCVLEPGPMPTPCRLWTGPTSGSEGRGAGYGRMSVDGGTMAPHIVMWVIRNGPIPPRKQLDHVCRNRLCVDHTELVTHKQNQKRRDAARRGLQDAARIYAEACA